MADSTTQSVCWGTVALVTALTLLTFVGVPLFAYFYDYTLLDRVLLAVLYIVTGMGITVGYHRLVAHQSFDCPDWVKSLALIAGGWALQNSALVWGAVEGL